MPPIHTAHLFTFPERQDRPLIVPATIVTEVCFMLAKLGPQAEAGFLRSLAAEELQVEPLASSDYARMADLIDLDAVRIHRRPALGGITSEYQVTA